MVSLLLTLSLEYLGRNKMHHETRYIQSGKDTITAKGSVNPPIYKTSTILFPSLKAYNDAQNGIDYYGIVEGVKPTDFSYGLGGTSTTHLLQKAIAELDGGDYSIIFPSGLCAITITMLSFLSAGDHVLMTDNVYGPTRRFCNKELKKLGVETKFYDPRIGGGIRDLIKPNTKIVFTESPGSLTFEVQDIPAIVHAVKEYNPEIVVIIDNSWATPIYFKAFEHGADVSIQAGTKYIGGHSDVFLGTVTAKANIYDNIVKTSKNFGPYTSPDECYMALRGLRTLPTRLKVHEKSALNVAKWLQKRKEVAKVLHPALPAHPDHKIFKRDFSGSTGLFSIILDKKYSSEALSVFIDSMQIFGIGASWGGYESLIIHFDPKPIRTAVAWQEEGSCIRLYIGLENEADIIEDLDKAFTRLANF